jgi:hypothetical protein
LSSSTDDSPWSTKNPTSDEDCRSGQQASSNRLNALEGVANQVRGRVEQLDISSASAQGIFIIKASVDSVAAQLKDLQLGQFNPSNAKRASPASPTRKAASRAKT